MQHIYQFNSWWLWHHQGPVCWRLGHPIWGMGRYESQDWAKWQINRNQRAFLVTTQKINKTIAGFNAIKHILQNKTGIETMVSILQTAFDNVDKSRMKSLLELTKQYDSNCSRAPEVKVKGKNITVSAGKIMHVNCKSNVGIVTKERAKIFQSKCV